MSVAQAVGRELSSLRRFALCGSQQSGDAYVTEGP